MRLKSLFRKACAIYFSTFLFSAIHIPSAVMELVSSRSPVILLAPLAAPSILRGYGQFVGAGIWPYGKDRQTVRFDKLLRAGGYSTYDGKPNGLHLSLRGSDIAAGEGKKNIMAGSDRNYIIYKNYYRSSYTNMLAVSGGGLSAIGKYFCLGNPRHGIIGSPTCARIVSRNRNCYWQEVGNPRMLPIVLRYPMNPIEIDAESDGCDRVATKTD